MINEFNEELKIGGNKPRHDLVNTGVYSKIDDILKRGNYPYISDDIFGGIMKLGIIPGEKKHLFEMLNEIYDRKSCPFVNDRRYNHYISLITCYDIETIWPIFNELTAENELFSTKLDKYDESIRKIIMLIFKDVIFGKISPFKALLEVQNIVNNR